MLYDGDGVYCIYCSKEGAEICYICKEILESLPEKIYEKIRNMTPKELRKLEQYLEGVKKSQDPKKTLRQRWHW